MFENQGDYICVLECMVRMITTSLNASSNQWTSINRMDILVSEGGLGFFHP